MVFLDARTQSPIPPPLRVVVGVRIHENRILLTQRLPVKEFPYHWECAGGKVERKKDGRMETDHEALDRELREELGIREVIEIEVDPLCSYHFDPPGIETKCDVIFYRVAWEFSVALPLEAIGIGWFTRRQIESGALELIPSLVRLREHFDRLFG